MQAYNNENDVHTFEHLGGGEYLINVTNNGKIVNCYTLNDKAKDYNILVIEQDYIVLQIADEESGQMVNIGLTTMEQSKVNEDILQQALNAHIEDDE